jgi:ribosomal protein S18 acetylase RimI-like enzyme
MSVTIRRATPADAPVIAEFNRRMALETENKILDEATLSRGVAALLADTAKGFYLVADHGGDVVGQLLITMEWSDWRNGWFWWIQSVYVRADARRHGTFRSLFEEAVQLAATSNVVGLRLYVDRDNERAQQTYRSLDMEETNYHLYERMLK